MATLQQLQHTNNNYILELVQELPQKQASLSKGLKTLYELWIEWKTGIAGMKPAKHFTHAKIGTCKALYSIQKVIWKQLLTMVNKCYAVHTTIDKIYECYGQRLSVRIIIDAMVFRNITGGHPNLR
jgi:hypothetical protein